MLSVWAKSLLGKQWNYSIKFWFGDWKAVCMCHCAFAHQFLAISLTKHQTAAFCVAASRFSEVGCLGLQGCRATCSLWGWGGSSTLSIKALKRGNSKYLGGMRSRVSCADSPAKTACGPSQTGRASVLSARLCFLQSTSLCFSWACLMCSLPTERQAWFPTWLFFIAWQVLTLKVEQGDEVHR